MIDIAEMLLSVDRVSTQLCIRNRGDSVLVDLTAGEQSYQFIMEQTVIGPVYMLDQWLMSQLQVDSQVLIYQQDGAPPHFHHDVREYLDAKIPSLKYVLYLYDSPLLPWPPRLPDLTPCEFFLWVYIKDHILPPPFAI